MKKRGISKATKGLDKWRQREAPATEKNKIAEREMQPARTDEREEQENRKEEKL